LNRQEQANWVLILALTKKFALTPFCLAKAKAVRWSRSKPEMQEAFIERLTASEIEFTYLGEVTALDEMMIEGQSFGTLTKAVELYDGVLGGKMAS
jgi:hypothetical protein